MITSVSKIIKSQFKLDFRNLGSWLGTVLFLVSASYITFVLFDDVASETWLAILWLIVLFSALQSFYSNFKQELSEKPLYYYTLYGAHEALFAKLIYQFLRLLMLSILAVALLGLFHGYPILHELSFWLSIVLGSLGLSAVLTLTSSMSHRADKTSSLLPIISLPLIIPFLLGVVNLSYKSILESPSDLTGDVGLVVALILLVIGLSILLFPLIWRD